jgi:dynein heavy chain
MLYWLIKISGKNHIYIVQLQVSKACTSICMWTGAMHKYHFVAKGVAPKRERLRIASEELAETQRVLAAAKARLAEVEEGIATLQAKYEDCVRKKDELEQKCAECEGRLVRADKVRNITKLNNNCSVLYYNLCHQLFDFVAQLH